MRSSLRNILVSDFKRKQTVEVGSYNEIEFNYTGNTKPKSLEQLGQKAFNECYKKYGKILRTLGNSLQDFLNGVDNFVELLKSKDKNRFFELPSLHCTAVEDQSELDLHCYDTRMRNEWDAFVVEWSRALHKSCLNLTLH
ncbi:Guanylate cyclase soluble subunit alpha-2 [Desmophyllum pertusum]|uniref:Guanylate cyclase soluble subunit alpha-2 n=1 Tax=Desmophyllum pertusum TaxID=174260 RepID=A0A9X0CDR6_9CNID|nr:Guanylate cyclase soluble subunit alpha-2 [Desmophyllum pertusum]